MPTLREIQTGFAAALLRGGAGVDAWIESDGIDAATRLDIHRNTVLSSLVDVLAAAFPVVRRLVDARFFAYAATAFVRAHPPCRPSLAEYGADFADFLGAFGPCRELAYLPDVARLEWTMAGVARAVERSALAPQALAGVANAEHLTFAFQPTIAFFASRFQVDAIWRSNQPGAVEEVVDLAAGPVHLEIRKHAAGVVLRRLDAVTFAFRMTLADGRSLGAAAEAALAAEAAFDLTRALADLFRDGAVVAVDLAHEKESRP